MYQVFYLYRVRQENVERFLRIVRAAGEVFRQHGATASLIQRVTDAGAKYGCRGLVDVLTLGADEALFLGIDSFEDKRQFELLMPKIDDDPQINRLFDEFQQVVDLKSLVRWEAEEM